MSSLGAAPREREDAIDASGGREADAAPSVSCASDKGEPLDEQQEPLATPVLKDRRFWLSMLAIFTLNLASAFLIMALPNSFAVLAEDLQTNLIVWVNNSLLISSIALMPAAASLATIFGAALTMHAFNALFAVGTIVCGVAPGLAVMLVGRTLQGLGNAGLYVCALRTHAVELAHRAGSLPQLLLSELVTDAERGLYLGAILGAWGLGSLVGPIVAGALGKHYRWLFWISLVLSGFGSVVLLPHRSRVVKRALSRAEQVARLDWLGSAIFIAATVSLCLGLSWAGVTYSWAKYRVVLSIILGLVGYALYFLYEGRLEHPTTPLGVFSSRTANAAMFAIGIQSGIQCNLLYYLPLWLQTVKLKDLEGSGVALLAYTGPFEFAGIVAGIWVSLAGRYRVQNIVFWLPIVLSLIFLALLEPETADIGYIGTFLLAGISLGALSNIWIMPLLAALPPAMASPALAAGCVARYLVIVVFTTIGSTATQNMLRDRLPPTFLELLPAGNEIAYTAASRIRDARAEDVEQIRRAFSDSLRVLWYTLIGPAFLAGIAACFIREHAMAVELPHDDMSAPSLDEKPSGVTLVLGDQARTGGGGGGATLGRAGCL